MATRRDLEEHLMQLMKMYHPTRQGFFKEEEIHTIAFCIRFLSEYMKAMDVEEKGSLN